MSTLDTRLIFFLFYNDEQWYIETQLVSYVKYERFHLQSRQIMTLWLHSVGIILHRILWSIGVMRLEQYYRLENYIFIYSLTFTSRESRLTHTSVRKITIAFENWNARKYIDTSRHFWLVRQLHLHIYTYAHKQRNQG